ncbi:MAG: hypothetical protein H5T86_13525, partial [Armatimonadetes bacterium]|nr:hypothetical protein [Armatimonadota bacterium]
MKAAMQWAIVGAAVLLAIAAEAAGQGAPRLREPWDREYAGGDATGEHVVALWQFNAGAETKDASGHGHDCRLEGARISP